MKGLVKDVTTVYAPVVAGAVAAGFAKNLAKKVSDNEKIQAAVPLAAGIVVSRMKSPALKNVGLGMIAASGRDLAGTFVPALRGIEDMDLSGIFGPVLAESFNVSGPGPVLAGQPGGNPQYDMTGIYGDY